MTENPLDVVEAIKKEASRIEEDSLYSSRGHFAAGGRWSRIHFWLGLPASIGSALAGASAFTNHPGIAAVLSSVVTALAATLTFLNPSDKASVYHVAGTRFSAVRGQARRFRDIRVSGGESPEALARELTELARSRDDLNTGSPQIPRWAFETARKSVEDGEADYVVDQQG